MRLRHVNKCPSPRILTPKRGALSREFLPSLPYQSSSFTHCDIVSQESVSPEIFALSGSFNVFYCI